MPVPVRTARPWAASGRAGTYTVLASFPGSTDYSAASTTATFTIAQAMPVLSVRDSGGIYNGAMWATSATVAGFDGNFGVSLEGVSPSVTYYNGPSAAAWRCPALRPVQAHTP